MEFVRPSSDIESIAANGNHGILLSFLNTFSFNANLSLIDTLYGKGVRVFGLAWAGNNEFTGSDKPLPRFGDKPDQPLTPLGEKAP